MPLYQGFYRLNMIYLCPTLMGTNHTMSDQRLKSEKQATGAISMILITLTLWFAWWYWQREQHMFTQSRSGILSRVHGVPQQGFSLSYHPLQTESFSGSPRPKD
jgi:hypothetical protein